MKRFPAVIALLMIALVLAGSTGGCRKSKATSPTPAVTTGTQQVTTASTSPAPAATAGSTAVSASTTTRAKTTTPAAAAAATSSTTTAMLTTTARDTTTAAQTPPVTSTTAAPVISNTSPPMISTTTPPATTTQTTTTATAPPPTSPNTVQVGMRGYVFLPSNITIKVGDTVIWTNSDTVAHTVTGPGFDSGSIVPGQTYQRTFGTPGTISYQCSIHALYFSMVGTIVVQ